MCVFPKTQRKSVVEQELVPGARLWRCRAVSKLACSSRKFLKAAPKTASERSTCEMVEPLPGRRAQGFMQLRDRQGSWQPFTSLSHVSELHLEQLWSIWWKTNKQISSFEISHLPSRGSINQGYMKRVMRTRVFCRLCIFLPWPVFLSWYFAEDVSKIYAADGT